MSGNCFGSQFVKQRGKGGLMPLMCACIAYVDDDQSIQSMLRLGADINAKDNNGLTPLMHLVINENCSTQAAKLLLDHSPRINTRVVDCAKKAENYEKLEQLFLEYGYIENKLINESEPIKLLKHETQQTSIDLALQSNQTDVLQTLLLDAVQGGDFNYEKSYKYSPLMVACRFVPEIIPQLIDAGADVNAIENRGYSVFHYACRYSKKSTINLLIENGADINAVDNDGLNGLYYASCRKNNIVATLLIDAGASINEYVDCDSSDEFEKHIDFYNFILNNFPENLENQINKELTTCRCVGIDQSKSGICFILKQKNLMFQFLLKNYPDLSTTKLICNMINKYTGLLSYACRKKPRIVPLLMQAGANIEEKNSSGATPLMKLFVDKREPSYRMVKYLINAGADATTTNGWGFTLLDYLEDHYESGIIGDNNYVKLKKILVKAGAVESKKCSASTSSSDKWSDYSFSKSSEESTEFSFSF